MSKFSDVFFASDFDRTLTGHDGVLPARNLEAIRYFIDEGGAFTVASGRSIPLFRRHAALVPVNAPCILYNGAACYDYRDGKLYFSHPLPDSAINCVREAFRLDPTLCVEIQGMDGHFFYGSNALNGAYLKSEGVPITVVTDTAPKPWIKIAVWAAMTADVPTPAYTPEDIARFEPVCRVLEAFCAGRYSVTRSMPYILEIGDPVCSKGSAARALADCFNRKILVCAGDAPNDVTILDAADFAFLPADCDETLRDTHYIKAAPSSAGTIADAIEQLEQLI